MSDEEEKLSLNDKMDLFEQQILDALKAKVSRSESTISDLQEKIKESQEKLLIKEAELVYVTNLYNEEQATFSTNKKSLEYKISTLEEKIKKKDLTILEKETFINDLTANMDDLSDKESLTKVVISSKDDLITKLSAEVEELNARLDELNENLIEKDNKIEKITMKKDAEILEYAKKLGTKEELIEEKDKYLEEKLDILQEKEQIIEEISVQFEKIQEELKTLKAPELSEEDLLSSERLICVKCRAVGKDIKTVEDKTKPISFIGNRPLYAKINVCKKCGHEF